MTTRQRRDELLQVLSEQAGVVFARPAIVHRGMYAGRGIIAKNTEFSSELTDCRGYLPVEWWIMSCTEAKNAVPLPKEGVTSLLIRGRPVLLTEALQWAESELMGSHAHLWPLTKVLDIGGVSRTPKLTGTLGTCSNLEPEVPPIPCHVHAGEVEGGHCVGHGKTEAYFFPPLDVPPYNLTLGSSSGGGSSVKTRLGLRPDVERKEVLDALQKFGRADDLYTLLNEYEIRPWESWTIEQKVIHAPGPWPTFEIQLPQDDFHLLAWQLGEQIAEARLPEATETYHLRGLRDDEQLMNETLDWEVNTAGDFREQWWRQCEVLEEGEWGRRLRLFYHVFYGEGFVVRPHQRYTREADSRPFAGIVWSGRGSINGQQLDSESQDHREFLVTPGHSMELYNSSSPTTDLIVFSVFPLTHSV